MEITISTDVFGLSSTKHLRRNSVLHAGDGMVMMWWLCNTSDLTQQSGLITHLASDLVGRAKNTIVLYGV
jgi:hypothetical protein